ncbi:hypothetical protein [Nonomuraea sp. NPDC050783]|uniref:hypothetical protein n=1 Tax=Nonomuraea sp. NPDC050783 TaxID=3154634 RepID=UPI003465021B
MEIRRLTGTAAVAATLAVAGVAVVAQPAAAAVSVSYRSSQGQFDNNPGSGAQAWAWVWTSSSIGAWIDVQYYDGTGGRLDTPGGTASSANLPKDVWIMRVCEYSKNQFNEVIWSCSGWKP